MTSPERTQAGDAAASDEANDARRKQRIGDDLSEPLKLDEVGWLEADLEDECGPREGWSGSR